MSRTFRRIKSVLNRNPYPCGPYVYDPSKCTLRQLYKAVSDGQKGQWSVPGTFTRQTCTIRMRRHARRKIHRAMLTEGGWDGFTLPRKWPRPYWW